MAASTCDDADMSALAPSEYLPDLVPELLVTDVRISLAFWVDGCGFEVKYDRPEEGFAYLTRGNAHLMLEQRGVGRNWVTGPLEPPLGRGINFQISVADADEVAAAVLATGRELFMPPETKWYRVGGDEVGVRQFLVTDPDGYLIRFQASLGRRAAS